MKYVTYWYQFFTRCEELVPIFHSVKLAECEICGSTLLSIRTQYSWKTRKWEKKYQHYTDVRGEVLPTPHGTTTAVAASK